LIQVIKDMNLLSKRSMLQFMIHTYEENSVARGKSTYPIDYVTMISQHKIARRTSYL